MRSPPPIFISESLDDGSPLAYFERLTASITAPTSPMTIDTMLRSVVESVLRVVCVEVSICDALVICACADTAAAESMAKQQRMRIENFFIVEKVECLLKK